jgi:hypothetical protein
MTPTFPARDLRPLFVVSLLMGTLTVVFAVAMLLDPRTIEGAPAWLKPAKFAVSTGIYGGTLVWVLGALGGWPRLRRVAVWTTATVFLGEVVLIAMQAWRGTTSHFNTSTVFDGVVFTAMGLGIFAQTAVAGVVALALWRQEFADRALGWAVRLGMTITVVGALTGGLMTRPTAAQLAAAQAGGGMPRSGAHTVGAPDGGPGLPGTGWSVTHGDLRVPHFVGLHAVQALPLFQWVVARGRRDVTRIRLVIGAGLAYMALYAILLSQALMGQPLTSAGRIQ